MTHIRKKILGPLLSEFEDKSPKTLSLLLVGKDETELQILIKGLKIKNSGLIFSATTGSRAIDILSRFSFDALIIRNNLPDMDGQNLCCLVRGNKISSPIILVSDENSSEAEILALESGANDFVSTHINPDVLAARIRTHIRHHILSGRSIFKLGRLRFDPTRRILRESSSPNFVQLTEKENQIIRYICSTRNHVVTPPELMKIVWNYHEESASTTLKTHIYNLRKKISDNLSTENFLVKERDGYRLADNYTLAI